MVWTVSRRLAEGFTKSASLARSRSYRSCQAVRGGSAMWGRGARR